MVNDSSEVKADGSAPVDGAEGKALVAAFVKKWEGVSGPKVADQVPGVEQGDVSRWRRGAWTYVTEAKAKAIRDDLQRTPDRVREEKLIAARWMRMKADELEREAAMLPPGSAEEKERHLAELADRSVPLPPKKRRRAGTE